ncbi:MAG TPA: DMT family transporter [Pseudidiomarina sp.]|nr:DMT family transporter [Pseudidiomarina sp.]
MTALAIVAFAGNSLLARLALKDAAIDAGSFTWIRLLAGVLTLFILLALRGHQPKHYIDRGSWRGAFALFGYAVAFSYAYVSLETGIGALILFTSVQLSMLFIGWWQGNRVSLPEWLGVILAFSGFVYLILPQLSLPDSSVGVGFMIVAGSCWGLYSLVGRGSREPLLDTASNFTRTLPMVGLLLFLTFDHSVWSVSGVWLAILSGSLTSAVGYAIWYLVLPYLTVTVAAVSQLTVPLVATLGGIVFANEQLTMRLLVATGFIVSGILWVVVSRRRGHNSIS